MLHNIGLIWVFIVISCIWCAPPQDEVTGLPGWNGPLPSKMYSGLLDCGILPPGFPNGQMFMHYLFIESERDPKNDPLVIWYNGGPGASSLFGLLVELGPLELNDLSINNKIYNETKIPQLIYNPYGWTKFSNLLVLDNPPPVGFSYCLPAGPTGDGYSCGNWNDSYVAKTNGAFLNNWFKAFPEYANNDLYIVGESYAGVYVPIISREIVQNYPGIKLRGFAVGDGCMGTQVLCGSHDGPYYDIEFMHGHGQFSNKLYRTIFSSCSVDDLKHNNLNASCQKLVDNMWDEIGGFYDYNLYDECIGRNIFNKNRFGNKRNWWAKPVPRSKVSEALNDYPCPGDAMDLWINRTDVRVALHVAVNSNFFDADNGNGFNYSLTEPNVLPFYKDAVTKYNLRALVYNGDTDPGLNSFVTQDIYTGYFDSQGFTQTQSWRPWTTDGKQDMGGYVIEYNNFHYLTIRGSGHMVPEYKPRAAYAFLSNFLANKDYPPYVPPDLSK